MVLFGVSNMIGDVYEIVNAMGKKVTTIVLNVPEQKRPRTKDLATRLSELQEQPKITFLEDFAPQENEEYFVVPVTPKKKVLIDFLRDSYNLRFSRLVHPSAFVSPYATLGQGIFVGALSVIGPGCMLHDHVAVGRGVTVGHDTVLHPYVHLNPGSNIAGHVEIFDDSMVGIGANVIEELIIGKGAVVAAGAVVLKDVPERSMVAGIPAIVKKTYAET